MKKKNEMNQDKQGSLRKSEDKKNKEQTRVGRARQGESSRHATGRGRTAS